MWSFRGGLKVLIDGLTEALGTRVKLGVTVRSLRKQGNQWYVVGAGQEAWQADVVVNTAPAYAMAEQLQDEAPALSEELAGIGFNAIAVVLLGYRQTDAPHQPDGFGYIAPQNTRRDVLGVQWCSSIFPGRAPDGCVLWRALCGGVHRSEMATLPDQDLIRRVHKEMRQTMQVRGEPVFTQVIRWPKAIPQYRVGHLARLERIHQLLQDQPGLILGGNSLYGVAMNDCCEQAERIAESLTSA
jgi:oxygen-dependent protoporphyrinogen oxidase